MFSLVLSVVVMSSNGGLLSERVPAAGMLLGAVDLVDSRAYDNMSVGELMAERTRLMDSMPSPGLGITLTAVGAGLFIVGFSVFWFASILVGVVMMVAALPLVIVGPILLGSAIRQRREVQGQVRVVDQRLASLNRGGQEQPFVPIVPSDNNDVPPPPPPRPPGSEFAPSVPADLLIASF